MGDEEWTWELSDRAADGLEGLDAETQQRVLDKLDDVVSDEFREPPDFAKPVTGAKPWQSLRVGDYLLSRCSTLFKWMKSTIKAV